MNEFTCMVRMAEAFGLVMRGDRVAWAVFSPCEKYRYALGRRWDSYEKPALSVTALNPSTATHEVLDPTLKKCAHFARANGCGGLLVTNLGAWRDTDPDVLHAVGDAVGPWNINFLVQAHRFPSVRVAAWGSFNMKQGRKVRLKLAHGIDVVRAEPDLHVFGDKLTKGGEPRHPLYLRNDTPLVRLGEARAAA